MDFERPPKSADEIDALPTFGTNECASHVRANGPRFTPETLVYLLRRAIEAVDTSLTDFLGHTLLGLEDASTGEWSGGHCEGIIMTVARDLGIIENEDRLRDFRAEVHAELWRMIHAGETERPFWEIRFGMALKQKCLDVARKQKRKSDHRKKSEVSTDDDGPDPPDPSELEDEVLARIGHDVLLAAIRELPDRQRRAAFLVWIEGRAKEGTDGQSASEIMDITPRAVYSLLKKARGRLSSHPRVRPMRDDR